MKKIIKLMVALGIMSLLLVGCSSNNDNGKTEAENTEKVEDQNENKTEDKDTSTKDEDTFVVGMEAAYAPFNWTQMDDSNGAVQIDGLKEYAGGYDVEMAKRIADGLGKKLVVKKMEWNGLPLSILSNKIDAVIAGMSPSDERREQMDFTDPYYSSDLVIVVKKDGPYSDVTSINDFEGAKITAMMGTIHYNVIDQVKGIDKMEPMDDFPAMRVALEAGKIDGYISEVPEAISASSANDNFTYNELTDGFVVEDPEQVSIAVGVAKDSELVDKINEILADIPQSERDQIMKDAIQNQPAMN
ncbi:MAG: transporter substrate-binding domain-containing protein [Tissierellia bacterium]|nr:transporter substrate-binding domain-containing protein [Tissierellia bacterium]